MLAFHNSNFPGRGGKKSKKICALRSFGAADALGLPLATCHSRFPVDFLEELVKKNTLRFPQKRLTPAQGSGFWRLHAKTAFSEAST